MASTINPSAIIAEAKRLSGLTWAEFDYALTFDGPIELGMAVGRASRTDPAQSSTYSAEREHEVWLAVKPAVAARVEAARARGFVGWSNASRGPIRYAAEVR